MRPRVKAERAKQSAKDRLDARDRALAEFIVTVMPFLPIPSFHSGHHTTYPAPMVKLRDHIRAGTWGVEAIRQELITALIDYVQSTVNKFGSDGPTWIASHDNWTRHILSTLQLPRV